jgi:hypothetical protein
MEQIASELLYFIFGDAELILRVLAVLRQEIIQYGSWMLFVSLSVFLFERLGKGCELCWRGVVWRRTQKCLTPAIIWVYNRLR